MARVIIRPARLDDAEALAPRLRACDVDECWSSARVKPLEALTQSVIRSEECYAAQDEDGVFALFGLSRVGDWGVPWMLGSDAVARHRRELVRIGREFTGLWAHSRPLTNVVDARNVPSVRYLKQLGFRVHDAIPYGPDGLPFHPFTMGA